jgi:hypothetical protein
VRQQTSRTIYLRLPGSRKVDAGDFVNSATGVGKCPGVSRHVAMAISGHKTESMYQRCNIVSEADLRAAAEKTQLYLDTLPTPVRR